MSNWLLPEYIQDVLPDEAWRIEQMRERILERMRCCGYQLVAPSLLEYAESLLISGSRDMDLRTFKLVDQLSGRTLALRADITPQTARIDAHLMNHRGITRLCYAGSVVHTQPIGLTRTRELLQIGAELFGVSGLDADLEIQRLMMEVLAIAGVTGVHLDLGHVGVFRALARHAGLSPEQEAELFGVLQRKDVTELRAVLADLNEAQQAPLLALTELYGEAEDVLLRARARLPQLPEVVAALDDLSVAVRQIQPLSQSVGLDLAELRGYHYHSGMVFAAYHVGSHDAIALGGRYDDLGKSFGRSRPATGFSLDLRQLYRLSKPEAVQPGILAPNLHEPTLLAAIEALRATGEVVVVDLLGDASLHAELSCDRALVSRSGVWVVEKI